MAIKHKRKATTGYTWLNTDLADGQIGVNTADGTLHVLKTDNTVEDINKDTATTTYVENRIGLGHSTMRPGGRLSLVSGDALPSSDIVAAPNIYYVPYVHDVIQLWDGSIWMEFQFTELSIALGTLANTFPHDVFCYLNGGVPTLEILAWASDSTQTTATTIQDGRYCKSGDKTRLWLGTILPKTITTCEDSELFRGVWNVYNREGRFCTYTTGDWASTLTTNGAYREYAGGNGVHCYRFVIGLAQNVPVITIASNLKTNNSSSGVAILIGDNQSTSNSPSAAQALTYMTSYSLAYNVPGTMISAAGKHTYYMLQRNINIGDCTSNWCRISGVVSQ